MNWIYDTNNELIMKRKYDKYYKLIKDIAS